MKISASLHLDPQAWEGMGTVVGASCSLWEGWEGREEVREEKGDEEGGGKEAKEIMAISSPFDITLYTYVHVHVHVHVYPVYMYMYMHVQCTCTCMCMYVELYYVHVCVHAHAVSLISNMTQATHFSLGGAGS